MSALIYSGDWTVGWQCNGTPTADVTTNAGTVAIYNPCIDTSTNDWYMCTHVDNSTPNQNLVWKKMFTPPSKIVSWNGSLQVTKSNAFPIFHPTVVSGGNAVMYLTDDGTATGNALFPNGADLNTFNFQAQENTAPHFAGVPVLSNSGKTLTVPVTKSTAVTILTISVLAATVAANGSTVCLSIWGN